MDRRKSLKALMVGTVSTGVLLDACKTEDKKASGVTEKTGSQGSKIPRYDDELANEKRVLAQDDFFTAEEMATITILADIIIPNDAFSGSASEAKVPEFIAFIVKDMPQHQTPMRGGLRWLDVQCLNRYEKAFAQCSQEQQIAMIDDIAYPAKAKPNMMQGVSFFNLMRNLTASGFYSTEMGWKDIGYVGNRPNKWNGVPDDVLKQYGYAYSEKEIKECVSYT
ncbi:MAG: gluconate 2-dehydrogenase subunit 3 family protein [Bacteroidota bacterium]